jgi:tRNA-splicing ligase RtcB
VEEITLWNSEKWKSLKKMNRSASKGKYLGFFHTADRVDWEQKLPNIIQEWLQNSVHCQKKHNSLHGWILSTHLGLEYWTAMNLAGDYASACHDDIHRRLVKAVGGRVKARIENHHNFAWKEITTEKK